jgi:hypothetical protein
MTRESLKPSSRREATLSICRPPSDPMIERVWRGWIAADKSEAYRDFLKEKFLPAAHAIPGYRGARVLRRRVGDEWEYMTITHFDSIEALGLTLVEEAFGSLRAMLRDVRRGDPAFGDIVDGSIAILVDHVHQQRSHFLFIARERNASTPAERLPRMLRFSSTIGVTTTGADGVR